VLQIVFEISTLTGLGGSSARFCMIAKTAFVSMTRRLGFALHSTLSPSQGPTVTVPSWPVFGRLLAFLWMNALSMQGMLERGARLTTLVTPHACVPNLGYCWSGWLQANSDRDPWLRVVRDLALKFLFVCTTFHQQLSKI
jgi:hypothetical protein